ncbi:MAG: methyltransferase domain-containing protein [Proteobacteria bacterium]|nr:methyltransferase domain-containing protein [Pseudomonadota bacterium]
MTEPVKVHLGSGPHLMPGWINVDYEADFKPEVVADLTQRFPFDDASVDYIHSEGVLCQFDLPAGEHFLNECFRILKPGGYMRLLTPDLRRLLSAYLDDAERGENQLAALWQREVEIPLKLKTSAEVINIGIRNLHKFMYDSPTLMKLLDESGFQSQEVGYQQSSVAALSGLDVRTPENATYMYFECGKPVDA